MNRRTEESREALQAYGTDLREATLRRALPTMPTILTLTPWFEALRAYGRSLHTATRSALLPPVPATATTTPWRHRLTVVATSVGVALFGNVGLALASNSAVPGDALYGLDRAYERIGAAIGLESDTVAERFDEAQVLLSRGDGAQALESAARGTRAAGLDPSVANALDEAGAAFQASAAALPEFGDSVSSVISAARSVAGSDLGTPGRSAAAHEVAKKARDLAHLVSKSAKSARDGGDPGQSSQAPGKPPTEPGKGKGNG